VHPPLELTFSENGNFLLRYLQEIGYADTILDVRSNRVRSLLGLNNNAETEENLNNSTASVNGNESSNKRASETQGRRTPAKKTQPSSLTEAMMLDTEAAVMANFEFLSPDVDMDDDDDMSDDLDDQQDDETDDVKTAKRKNKVSLDFFFTEN
jgi:striatin 1/3/4